MQRTNNRSNSAKLSVHETPTTICCSAIVHRHDPQPGPPPQSQSRRDSSPGSEESGGGGGSRGRRERQRKSREKEGIFTDWISPRGPQPAGDSQSVGDSQPAGESQAGRRISQPAGDSLIRPEDLSAGRRISAGRRVSDPAGESLVRPGSPPWKKRIKNGGAERRGAATERSGSGAMPRLKRINGNLWTAGEPWQMEGAVHYLINDNWQSKMNNVLVNSKHGHLIEEWASSPTPQCLYTAIPTNITRDWEMTDDFHYIIIAGWNRGACESELRYNRGWLLSRTFFSIFLQRDSRKVAGQHPHM